MEEFKRANTTTIYTRRANGSLRIQTINNEPTKTQQQFKGETDVNQIIKKYKKTGIITHTNSQSGTYADLSEVPSYEQAMQTVINADNAFNALPSAIRYKFHNNPEELIQFLKNKENRAEAIKLGLIQERKAPEVSLKDIQTELQETRKQNSKAKKPPTQDEE